MQVSNTHLFKQWVPEWLARTVIFGILLTSLLGFGLYYSNAESAIGYYGIEPADIQYSVVLMYAAGVSFFALDFRIVKYFSPRKYILAALALNFTSYLVCFYIKDLGLFMVCRYAQGVACALLCSVVLNSIFPRLHATRSRVIGYTVFYGGLQTSIPISAIYCSAMLHYFDFQWLFYGLIILMLPVLVTVLLTMNAKARFHKKMPLYQVDWVGYLFYAIFCCVFGYVLVYGQQLNWLDGPKVLFLSVLGALLLMLFIVRETRLKRPLINLELFKLPSFIIGLFLLIAFYVFKGTSGFAYSYIQGVLGVDPLNVIPIWTANIVGIALAMFVTARFVLSGKPLIGIIICGFVVLALFYVYMLTFVSVTGETSQFILPLFIHGAACGILFVPIVIFTVSAVPPKIAYNVSMLGIFFRFIGFCLTIGINNYSQLYTRAAVREKLRESVNETNPQLAHTLKGIQENYSIFGNDPHTGNAASSGFLDKLVRQQIVARSIRDYHDIMLIGLLLLILLLLVIPGIRKIVLRLSGGTLPY
ncbi:Major Facilitator Superfamily protein [Chitinophaga sp. CF118]|uniref:MFS transporter n=1 Tax=Chitinophaga sp. CF118 TaxID=1884367 RepID=UPI0008EF02E5|nr:MFS transporter [Chitinophaga sp. CF118]SFD86195.1 Major Facilitator Superfamily protein [Chitinophaga sp. CF118]